MLPKILLSIYFLDPVLDTLPLLLTIAGRLNDDDDEVMAFEAEAGGSIADAFLS